MVEVRTCEQKMAAIVMDHCPMQAWRIFGLVTFNLSTGDGTSPPDMPGRTTQARRDETRPNETTLITHPHTKPPSTNTLRLIDRNA